MPPPSFSALSHRETALLGNHTEANQKELLAQTDSLFWWLLIFPMLWDVNKQLPHTTPVNQEAIHSRRQYEAAKLFEGCSVLGDRAGDG